MQRRATDDAFNASTMVELYDPSSEDHQNRLKTRQGLQIYRQKYPNAQWKTQQFDIDLADGANEKNREWDGATQDGITTIRSGPDFNKVNVTLIVPDGSDLAIKERLRNKSHQHPTNLYLSLFVGCFDTPDEAAEASKAVNQLLTHFALLGGTKATSYFLGGEKQYCSQLMEKYAHGKRSQYQLNLGLRLCGTCHQKFSEKKCGGCKFQWYCCVEHQKEDWTHHKPICKDARVKRKEASKNIKTAKKTEKLNQKKNKTVTTSLQPLILTPPATKQEKQDVSDLHAFLVDLDGNRLHAFQKINYLDIMQKHPRDWTILVQEHPDWLSKMSELIIEADFDKSDFKKNAPVFGLWFIRTFLVNDGKTNTLECNALRIFQYMVDTENGFESVLVGLYRSLQQMYHPKTSKSNRQRFFESAREIFRILDTSILLNEVVASQIVTTHIGKPSIVLLFQEMHEMVQKPKNRTINDGMFNELRVIENHLLSTIGLIHVWTIKLQVHVIFFDEMKFNNPNDELFYRTMHMRLSEIQIKEGRTLVDMKVHEWLEETQEEAKMKARKDMASNKKKRKKQKKKNKKNKIIPFFQRYQKRDFKLEDFDNK